MSRNPKKRHANGRSVKHAQLKGFGVPEFSRGGP
jgi:hypothetical protein